MGIPGADVKGAAESQQTSEWVPAAFRAGGRTQGFSLMNRAGPIMASVPNENVPEQDSYRALLGEIKERIRSAQYVALRAVNLELLSLYWDIGRLIDQRQRGETWGRAVVENLAADLRAEFPGIGGFSAANLWRIKQFHEAYSKDEKLAPLVREISWTKNLVILERCKDSAQRQFYLERTKQFGWTKNVLIHQIENKTYEKTLFNQTNFDTALPEEIRNQASLPSKTNTRSIFWSLPTSTANANWNKRFSPGWNRSS